MGELNVGFGSGKVGSTGSTTITIESVGSASVSASTGSSSGSPVASVLVRSGRSVSVGCPVGAGTIGATVGTGVGTGDGKS